MKISRFMGLFGTLLLSSLFKSHPEEKAHFRGINYASGGYNPEFHPKRTKFKGWMRENRRCTFNKHR